MSILIGLSTFALVIISVLMVLLVLAQKSKSDGGVGGALGGGMTEATFGADSGNVLSRMTHYGAIAFFVLSFGLYLAQINRHGAARTKSALPSIEVPAVTIPAAAPAVVVPATSSGAPVVAEAPSATVTLPATSVTEPAAKP